MQGRLRLGALAAGLAALLLAGGGWAAESLQPQAGTGRGGRAGQERPRPVLGVITAVDGGKVTIKPEIPQWMAAKLEERGKPLPELPQSISFWIGTDTVAFRDSAKADASSFRVGERIVARLDGDPLTGEATARRIADEATAEARLAQLKQWRNERGAGMRGRGERGERRMERRPLLGKIKSIEGGRITVTPVLPEWAQQRAEAAGRELPELPESLSFSVDAETKFILNDEPASLGDFKVGDEIAAMLTGRPASGEATALKVADLGSAQRALAEGRGRGGERGEGRGQGGREDGPEGRGHRPRPMFGVVLSVDGDSITIKPERPEFVKNQMKERGGEGRGGERGGGAGERGGREGRQGKGPRELPAELTVTLTDETMYFQNEKEVGSNPFKVGDHVAIMPGRPDGEGGDPEAHAVSDYATAEARMKEHMREGGPHGEGRGGGEGRGRGRNKDGRGQSE